MELVVTIKFGSHLYGTNTPLSDIDYKSVYLPTAREIILQRVPDSVQIGTKRSKAEGERNLSTDIDNEAYSLQRYLSLLAEGQTGAIDMLFAPDEMLLENSFIWRKIQQNRKKLLTKRSAAFVGYCRTQANKYGIKGSRVAAAKSAMERFIGLMATAGATAKVGEFFFGDDFIIDEHTYLTIKETTKGNRETYFVCCDRMVGFKNTLKEAAAIFTRIYNMYGDRARKAETNEGIDWKALSHAVRVGHEALELLNTHYITFPLPNAAHLVDIKQGKLTYKAVAEEIEQLLAMVECAAQVSTLPDEADYAFIDELVYTTYRRAIA